MANLPRNWLISIESAFAFLPRMEIHTKLSGRTGHRPSFGPRGMSLQGVKYLLNFEPFGSLPRDGEKEPTWLENSTWCPSRAACFSGVSRVTCRCSVNYRWPTRFPCYILWNVMRLLMASACPNPAGSTCRGPTHPSPHEDFGPIRNTFRRTHRWARVHRYEDELSIPGRLDHIVHVLFSTAPNDLDLYGKPMARNSQIWTQDHHLLLDGPNATQTGNSGCP